MLNGLFVPRAGRDERSVEAPPLARRSARAARAAGAGNAVDPLRPTRSAMMDWDKPLLFVSIALMLLGVVMVYSASIALSDSPRYPNLKSTYFLGRQALFVAIGLAAGLVAFRIPLSTCSAGRPGCSWPRLCC